MRNKSVEHGHMVAMVLLVYGSARESNLSESEHQCEYVSVDTSW